MACLISIVNEFYSFRSENSAQLSTITGVLGENSAAALVFEDSRHAGETLTALRTIPSVRWAGLYNKRGDLFASYRRDSNSTPPPPRVLPAGWYKERAGLIVVRDVELEGEKVGTISVLSDQSGLYIRVVRYLLLTVLALAIPAVIAGVFYSRVLKILIKPIHTLTRAARLVSLTRVSSVRAAAGPDDEIGELIEEYALAERGGPDQKNHCPRAYRSGRRGRARPGRRARRASSCCADRPVRCDPDRRGKEDPRPVQCGPAGLGLDHQIRCARGEMHSPGAFRGP